MTRLPVLAVLICVALTVCAAALGVSKKDRVRGTAQNQTIGGFPNELTINAKSGSAGEDAKGRFSIVIDRRGFDLGLLEFRGDITCLAVDRNRAAMKAVVDFSSPPSLVPLGTEVRIQVEDNGDASAGADRWGDFVLEPEEVPIHRRAQDGHRDRRPHCG